MYHILDRIGFRIMKISSTLIIIAAVTIIISCSSNNVADNNVKTVTYPHEFNTSENLIVDESGNETVFKGVSIENPILLSHSFQDKATMGPFYFDQYLEWNESIFQTISQFGATIVRLPVHPATWRVHGQVDCLAILDEAIAWATKYKFYVILDFHSVGYPLTGDFEPNFAEGYGELFPTAQPEMLSFWSIVSEHYKNNKTVAFYELYNEPVYPSFASAVYTQQTTQWNNWKTFSEEIIDTIRAHDQSATVIVGGLNWTYDLSYLSLNPSNAVNRSNVIYSVHPYPGSRVYADSSVADWDLIFGNESASYPIFVTEFGFLSDDINSVPYYEGLFVGDTLYRDAIKSYLTNKRISWTAWCFSPYTWPKLLQDKNYTLTDAGSFVTQWMQE